MRILIVNDDGVDAGQLLPLIRWCRKLGEVTTFVPKFEQSGKSHGFEIHKPFEVKEVSLAPDVTVWAVDSTPADCVRFAVLGKNLEFDLVISGVNRGLNIGTDMMYSGTVGAACEAVNLGMKAVALSTPPSFYDRATEHLDTVLNFFREKKLLDLNPVYNVNIPGNPKGIRITRQGRTLYADSFPPLEGGLVQTSYNNTYVSTGTLDTDMDAIHHGYHSVTPLTIERTQMDVYRQLKPLND